MTCIVGLQVHSGLIEVRDMFADLDRLVKSQEVLLL